MAKRKASQNGGTAVAEAPKKRGRPPKQPMLNDDPAFQRIQKLEDLAQALDEVRSQRISLTEDEDSLQTKLADAMREEKLETYSSQCGLVVLEHLIKDKVKIKKVRMAKEDGSLS